MLLRRWMNHCWIRSENGWLQEEKGRKRKVLLGRRAVVDHHRVDFCSRARQGRETSGRFGGGDSGGGGSGGRRSRCSSGGGRRCGSGTRVRLFRSERVRRRFGYCVLDSLVGCPLPPLLAVPVKLDALPRSVRLGLGLRVVRSRVGGVVAVGGLL